MQTILYDVTHTAHTGANSGIQRVTRRLAAHWPAGKNTRLNPIVYDRYAHEWRHADAPELDKLASPADRRPGVKRGSSWSVWQRTRGRAAKILKPLIRRVEADADALLCPELFANDPRLAQYPRYRTHTRHAGKMIAVFHDMIALRMPELTPRRTVENFHAYLESLLAFDIIAADSDESRDSLIQYWKQRNIIQTPRIISVPLGVDTVAGATPVTETHNAGAPLVLCVGTLEARKNHLALLDACERLWAGGKQFRLRLIGMLNQETGSPAAQRVRELAAAGRPVEWLTGASDAVLYDSYNECNFTVYPSLLEGFGLPVLESLAHGRPCICSGLNAMSEIVRDGGGCMAVGEPTAGNIARGMDALLADGSKVIALSREALARKIRTWDDYAAAMRALV